MSRQRYLITLIVFGVGFAAACHDREPRPSMYGPRSENHLVRPGGDRSVVRDAEGDAVLKIRRRGSNTWDVFDDSMQFVGQVRSDAGYVEWRPKRTGEWTAASLEQETWEMSGKVRLEALSDGWTVFDAKNQMLGYVRYIDEHWERRDSFDGAATWKANDGKLEQVGADAMAVTGEAPGDGVLIALTFEELGAVERVALGRFIDSKAAENAVSKVRQLAEEKAADRAAASIGAGLSDVGAAVDAAVESSRDSAQP